MNKIKLKQFIDLLGTTDSVWGSKEGLPVECVAHGLQTNPVAYILKRKGNGKVLAVDEVYFTEPSEIAPEKGRLVERGDGSLIQSSGEFDGNGDLLDVNGKAWPKSDWTDKVAEAKIKEKAEAEAEKLAKKEEKTE